MNNVENERVDINPSTYGPTMKEIFIIERLVLDGIWELAIPTFYPDETTAKKDCIDMISKMQKVDTTFCARVKKLNYFRP